MFRYTCPRREASDPVYDPEVDHQDEYRMGQRWRNGVWRAKDAAYTDPEPSTCCFCGSTEFEDARRMIERGWLVVSRGEYWALMPATDWWNAPVPEVIVRPEHLDAKETKIMLMFQGLP